MYVLFLTHSFVEFISTSRWYLTRDPLLLQFILRFSFMSLMMLVKYSLYFHQKLNNSWSVIWLSVLSGAIGCVWFVVWMLVVHDTPAQHPGISKEEKDYIETSVGTRQVRGHHYSIELHSLVASCIWNIVCVWWADKLNHKY